MGEQEDRHGGGDTRHGRSGRSDDVVVPVEGNTRVEPASRWVGRQHNRVHHGEDGMGDSGSSGGVAHEPVPVGSLGDHRTDDGSGDGEHVDSDTVARITAAKLRIVLLWEEVTRGHMKQHDAQRELRTIDAEYGTKLTSRWKAITAETGRTRIVPIETR